VQQQQQQDPRWMRRRYIAARGILKAVPKATAVQVGSTLVAAASPTKPEEYASGTRSHPPGRTTFAYFVQSNPDSKTGVFDSYKVYVEFGEKRDDHGNRDILCAIERASRTLYGKWAKDGSLVHVLGLGKKEKSAGNGFLVKCTASKSRKTTKCSIQNYK
jgi:hypothetical protein